MKANTSIAAKVMVPATKNSPEVREPVWVFSQPIRVGLTKPARFPVELINAIPAAAAVPPRKEVGSAQNIGKAEITPAVASVRPIIAGIN